MSGWIGRSGVSLLIDVPMCGCPVNLVTRWLLPDQTWMEKQVTEQSDPEADGDEFLARRAVAWIIMCPQCGTAYSAGGTSR